MEKVNYRETQLWSDVKNLTKQVYKLTIDWPERAKSIEQVEQTAQSIVSAVPNAFIKPSITGNYHLDHVKGQFGKFEALFEIVIDLGFTDSESCEKISQLLKPIEEKFRELSSDAKKYAREKRSRMTAFDTFDDEDDW